MLLYYKYNFSYDFIAIDKIALVRRIIIILFFANLNADQEGHVIIIDYTCLAKFNQAKDNSLF